jgi:poly(A) polymerase Pap1
MRIDSMRTVEIRWKQVAPGDQLTDFNSYMKEMEDVDTPTAVEDAFSTWLKEKVEGKKVIVSDMEFYVDGEYFPIQRGNELSDYYKRLKEAAGR